MTTVTRRQQGFTLAEVALAMAVFLMTTLMFAAIFPTTIRAAHYGNNYAQAALLAQHKIDQVRSAGYDKVDCADLQSLAVIDPNAACPTGATPTYSFTGVDNLTSVFPAGSTGTITVADYSAVANVTNPPPSANALAVTVNIQWSGAGTAPGSYKCTALIVKYTHR